MKLIAARVRYFKCVRDSGKFKVDPKVTCLVGKNESGKTALLEALYKLNPQEAEAGTFSFDLEYPRDTWDEGKRETAGSAIFTEWALDKEDQEALDAALGPKTVTSNTVKIEKGYSGQQLWTISADESAAVEHLLETGGLHAEVREKLSTAKNVKELHEQLSSLDQGEKEKALLSQISSSFAKLTATDAAFAVLSPRLPKMVYVPDYHRMAGQISVSDLKQRIAEKRTEHGHRVFLALLDLVGAKIEDLENQDQFEPLVARLEAASNQLSRQIFRYWSQNRHLLVKILFNTGLPKDPTPFNSGWIVRTRVENTRHAVTVSFDDRSAGFVWFFSFLVWFSQAKKTYGDNLVLLLDEPGLSLHARAQADLLRYIEEQLAPKYQVLYTAHSPFMIDPQHLLRARTVEDVYREPKEGDPPIPEDELGTKVGDQVLSRDKDTVFPLQACLGYEITQTLFVGKHTLLVEGPSEILYFQWFSRRLAEQGRTLLDGRWTICPCGGIDKVPAFLSLFAGNALDIAVFTDFAWGQKRRVRDLRESQLLKDGRVLTAKVSET